MPFIQFSSIFLLLLSTCSVHYAFKTDLNTYDIAPLTKRAYSLSDDNGVKYLSVRDRSMDDSIAEIWNKRKVEPIKYGQDKHVFDVPGCVINGGPIVIRTFAVRNYIEAAARKTELQMLSRAKQLISLGHEVIETSEKTQVEVWYVVQKKVGNAAEDWGNRLNKKNIPALQTKARRLYRTKYKIQLSALVKNQDHNYVYWKSRRGKWNAEIVDWIWGEALDAPVLPPAEPMRIFPMSESTLR